jgi:hypothetical protein
MDFLWSVLWLFYFHFSNYVCKVYVCICSFHIACVQFCLDQLITEHMIIVAGTRKTGMKCKLLIIQEKLDIINMVDTI